MLCHWMPENSNLAELRGAMCEHSYFKFMYMAEKKVQKKSVNLHDNLGGPKKGGVEREKKSPLDQVSL